MASFTDTWGVGEGFLRTCDDGVFADARRDYDQIFFKVSMTGKVAYSDPAKSQAASGARAFGNSLYENKCAADDTGKNV